MVEVTGPQNRFQTLSGLSFRRSYWSKSTSDLISEDGTVKTFLPPNSRSFILGPLVDGYVPNHGYDNYSNIGYIQKDTRQFVLLQEFKDSSLFDLHSDGQSLGWDGNN